VGVGVTVDLFDWKRYRSLKEVRDHRVDEARARESESSIELRTLIEQARIAFEASVAISRKTPEAVHAARELLTQSEVRYRTGLGTITELAEAQRTLQQSEVDDAIAKVNVWRAAFGVAAARGDLEAFLDQTN
jgi:outer membrane protein TolC